VTEDPSDLYAAFLRCSNEELQDPNLSLARQLHTCQQAVDKWGGRIVAVYYEVETGSARYQQRGSGTDLAGFDIPIPRAGGLHELVADAARKPKRFGRVICESIDRLARNSAVAFTLEDEFRGAGVGLHCANEPLEESFGSIVLRHLNVGLARGYLFNLKQASRGGSETATREGWHMGGTPVYGYRLVPHQHPNPHKRKRGLHRHTLDLDPVRAPVVRRIFDEYLYGTRGLNEIRDLLNTDLDRYPVPVPTDPARRADTWNRSTIWYILRNPKYTGYQVWNRRANKTGRGRNNPPEQWTWSDTPAHPAIISRDEYQQVQVKAAHNQRSGRTPRSDAKAPEGADYLFRNRVVCAQCDLRMWGNRRNTTRYYLCRPAHQRGTTPPATPPPSTSTNRPCCTPSPTPSPPRCTDQTAPPTGSTRSPPPASPTSPARPARGSPSSNRQPPGCRHACAARSSTSKTTSFPTTPADTSPAASPSWRRS
jgi:DNA invertase Pin-like site-specific DNA recombinase